MPRLGSKKSRTGCQQCKTRRVKCDEKRPCSNCHKYGADCSLLHMPPSDGLDRQVSRSAAAPFADVTEPASTTKPPQISSVPPSSTHAYLTTLPEYTSGPRHDQTSGWMQDLELMHHYTAHAYLTMPGVDQAKQTWGYAVPQEAFRHPFLMHCMLAFSAYHLAYLNPSFRQQYTLLASSHQTAAIAGIRALLPDITARNCHALFAAASLTTVTAFAASSSKPSAPAGSLYPESPNSFEALIEIFHLLRGNRHIVKCAQSLISEGPFSVLLRPAADSCPPPPMLSNMLEELQNGSEGLSLAYVRLRQAIEYTLAHSQSSHATLRVASHWPMILDPECMEALRTQQDPEMKQVLAQYCRILEAAAVDWWFLQGWRKIDWI